VSAVPTPDARTRYSSRRAHRDEDQAWPEFDAEGRVQPRGPRHGDVRAGSVKRVASAVGEGSVVVSAVHAHLGGR